MKPTASELKRMRSSAQLVLKPSKKDEYFQCGFQIHVEQAAVVIAAVGICSSLVKLILWRNYPDNIAALVFTVVTMLSHAAILCAQHTKIPKLYIPYLLVNPICILALIHFYVTPLIGVVLTLPHLKRVAQEGKLNDDVMLIKLAQPVAILELLLFAIAILSMVWFELTVYKAYRYMVHNNKSGNRLQNGEAGGVPFSSSLPRLAEKY